MEEGLSREDKIALSDTRAEGARSFLEDAEYSHDGERYRTSVNRSYYAVLHMARSLLVLIGVSPTSHEGVRTMLALHFVKDGQLSKEALAIFKELLDRRTDVDYGDYIVVDKQRSHDSLMKAKKFIAIVEKLRKRLVKEMKD